MLEQGGIRLDGCTETNTNAIPREDKETSWEEIYMSLDACDWGIDWTACQKVQRPRFLARRAKRRGAGTLLPYQTHYDVP
jgi:hypothetical protein